MKMYESIKAFSLAGSNSLTAARPPGRPRWIGCALQPLLHSAVLYFMSLQTKSVDFLDDAGSHAAPAALEIESVLQRYWKKALLLSWTNFIAFETYLVRAAVLVP
jgi:hypothetical protein